MENVSEYQGLLKPVMCGFLNYNPNNFFQYLKNNCNENNFEEILNQIINQKELFEFDFFCSMFRFAVSNHLYKIVDKLLAMGYYYDDKYYIKNAAICGDVEIVELLLKDGRADPTKNNNEALVCAYKEGHMPVVNVLLNDQRVQKSVLDLVIKNFND